MKGLDQDKPRRKAGLVVLGVLRVCLAVNLDERA